MTATKTLDFPITMRVGAKNLTITTYANGNKVWKSYEVPILLYVADLDIIFSNPLVDERPLRTNSINSMTTVQHLAKLKCELPGSPSFQFQSEDPHQEFLDKLAFYTR